MKSIIKKCIQTGVIALGVFALAGLPMLAPTTVSAANQNVNRAQDGVEAIGGTGAGNNANSFTNLIENIINLLLFIIGAIAVIMIIIGGIRYTLSNGDQGAVTSAKNTILYAVVGLVIAIMAYAIVNFVLRSLR